MPYINLGMQYASMYLRDGKNFVTCFKRFASVRGACEEVVFEYRKMIDMKNREKDFSQYAAKHATGKDVQTLTDILYIIYQITKE